MEKKHKGILVQDRIIASGSLKYLFSLAGLILVAAAVYGQPKAPYNKMKIWFNHPAHDWNEALPVGNGILGAMLFGGITNERLQMNEESVWTGKPEDFVNPMAKAALPEVRKLLFAGKYAEAQKLAQEKMMGDKKVWSTYQTLGDLLLGFDELEEPVSEYRRELDLETAVARVSYKSGSIRYSREVFASAPARALFVKLSASKPGSLNFSITLSRPGNQAKYEYNSSGIIMTEHTAAGTGVKLAARLRVLNEGGNISVRGESVRVEKADSVTLILTAATDYRGNDPIQTSSEMQDVIAGKNYEVQRSEHISDYQHYFKRVDLNLGVTNAAYFPTDSRLDALRMGNSDPDLFKLYYQFGRYLLISSSRPGSLPANLQGIWADGLTPPWSADYHININIQMNYWPAEITNLSEMHLPFLEFINALRPDGRKTARDMYGLSGTVAHFTTDPWYFTETYGKTQWAMWPMGMAWSCRHLWEHYLFNGDKIYLNGKAYPAMKEAASFCMAWLCKDPASGKLVSGPSISPENTFRTAGGEIATMVMGPTMDHMIIRELLQNTISAAEILGKDAALTKKMRAVLKDLAPTRIGADGRIMEWTEEFDEPEPGHRHISHLFGLYPGHELNGRSPELLSAARKTLEFRLKNGGGHTGWSRAWIINFFARLNNGEEAYQNLVALLSKSTLPNLFDNHPPFQIDGNFGATAGITEMLLQSQDTEIDLLPALPAVWQKGYIHGIVARGGFEVDIDWDNGELREVKVLSRLGNSCTLNYQGKKYTFKTKKAQRYKLNGSLEMTD